MHLGIDERVVSMEIFSRETSKFILDNMRDMLHSYRDKDPNKSTTEWIADEMAKRVPETKEVVAQYGKEIISGVDSFNESMMSIDAAIKSGSTKEEWLRQQMKEQVNVEDIDAVGNKCAEFSNNAQKTSIAYMDAMKNGEDYVIDDQGEEKRNEEEYNNFKLNKSVADLNGQIEFASEVALISGSDMGCPKGYTETDVKNNQDFGDMSGESVGSEKDRLAKVTAVAALKVAANMKKIPFLNKNTPIGTIVCLGCAGVECVKTMKQLYDKKLNVREAVERIGMTTCVTAAECITKGIVTAGLTVISGPAVAMTVAPIVCNMATEKVSDVMINGFNRVKEYVMPLAEVAYEKTKPLVEFAKGAFNKVMNLVKEI